MLGGQAMENIGFYNMKKELEALNPTVQFDMNDPGYAVHVIYGTVPGENLHLPEGYYYNTSKESITNKHNTGSGLYEFFSYEFDTEHFSRKPVPTSVVSKKSFFARLFGR